MNNKNNKIKIITKSIFFVLVLFLLVLSVAYIPNSITTVKATTLNPKTWKSDLAEINSLESTNNYNYISIKDFINVDETGKVIEVLDPNNVTNEMNNTCIMISNGMDVYYFSEICNPLLENKTSNPYFESYLGFNYVLGADIDYEDASKKFNMVRPIGWGEVDNKTNTPFDHTFHGTFDGRGYTISNLFFKSFENQEEYDTYFNNKVGTTIDQKDRFESMVHIAWFANNTGTIKNLGIINPNIIQFYNFEPAITISPFVGQNFGLIENCYLQDLRGNNAGLSAEGGYEISMFVSINGINPSDKTKKGIIKNSYVASDRIVSNSVQMTTKETRFPFVNSNTSTIENCYYDGSILKKFNNSYNEKVIEGLSNITYDDFTTGNFINNGSWYTIKSYDKKYQPYIRITYPVLKGLKQDANGYFVINNSVELVYMSQLIDKYQIFRSSKFLINQTIDLNSVKKDSFVFTNKVFDGVLEGKYDNNLKEIKFSNNTYSPYPAIINLNINSGISYNGYHAYGLFGILSGTVKNLNIYNANITLDDIKTPNYNETNTIGTICGLLEGGTIQNVNVKSNINLTNSKQDTIKYLGKLNVGGISGTILNGQVTDVTTTGVINSIVYSKGINASYENSIGGVIGKTINDSKITNCLNNIKINVPTYDFNTYDYKQYIGGVIGSGKLDNTTKLQNNNDIIITANNTNYYSLTYIGGVVGRVNDALLENGLFLNNGNITYPVNDRNYKAYISGVMNIISDVANRFDVYDLNKVKLIEGETSITSTLIQDYINNINPYTFVSLTNSGTINITNNLTNTLYPNKYQVIPSSNITDGLDLRCAGISYSYLTNYNVNGAYNLNHHFIRDIDGKIIEEDNQTQEIDISLINEFAPTFNSDNRVILYDNKLHVDNNIILYNSNIFYNLPEINYINSYVNLEKVYNERNILYNTHSVINSYMLELSGNITGVNFNLENIHNTGNINIYITNDTYQNMLMNEKVYFDYFGDLKKIKVYGIIEEVSINTRSKDLYNGGNIIFSTNNNAIVNFNLYVSGICYKNIGNDDSSTQNLMIERGYVGSLHNSINNGNIRVTYGDINTNPKVPGKISGESIIAGITCFNSSTISQTLNLGDIYNNNECIDIYNVSPTIIDNNNLVLDEASVESAGLAYIMQNEQTKVKDPINNENILTRANIIDCANNGRILSLNSGNQIGYTYASGIVCRNECGEDYLSIDNIDPMNKESHLQKIEYTINYGDIIAYNNHPMDFETENFIEQNSICSGFLAKGACTIVDVVNYGNIFGNSNVSGIFGLLPMTLMSNGGLSIDSKIYIANSLNYGKVQNISNNKEPIEGLINILISGGVIDSTKYYINHSFQDNPRSTLRVAGAFIGMITQIGDLITTESEDVLKTLNIRNLVNFNENINILGGVDEIIVFQDFNILNDFMKYMATTKDVDESAMPFKTDADGRYGIKCYSKDNVAPNPNITDKYSKERNGGIFNDKYVLQNPPAYVLDSNNNIDSNKTDNFIADYIQFIPYSKVNEFLLKKIDLYESVFINSLELAQKNKNLIHTILESKMKSELNINEVYNNIVKDANTKLVNIKNDLIEFVKTELAQTTYTDQEVKDIFDILMNQTTNLDSNFDMIQMKTLVSSLVDKMDSTQIDKYFKKILTANSNITSLLKDGSVELGKYFEKLCSDPNLDVTTKDKLIKNVYGKLIIDNPTLNPYINYLENNDLKITLSNDLYALLSNNNVVKNSLANLYYPTLKVDSSNIELIKNILTKNGQAGNNSNISENEFVNIYNELQAESKTSDEVISIIEGLTYEELKQFVTNLKRTAFKDNGKVLNKNLNEFINVGRANTTNIILPATKEQYKFKVNQNYIQTKNDNVNTKYIGNFYNINGKSIKEVEKGDYKEITVNDNAYFTFKGENYYYTLSGTDFIKNTGTLPPNPFDIEYIGMNNKQENPNFLDETHMKFNSKDKKYKDYIPSCDKKSGIYAIINSKGDFTNIVYNKYINYGKGINSKTFNLLVAMEEELKNNANSKKVKDYLINIYNNAIKKKKNHSTFVNVLNQTISGSGTQNSYDINFIIKNLNDKNGFIVLNNITSQNAKIEITETLKANEKQKNYSKLIYALLKQLKQEAVKKNSQPELTEKLLSILPKMLEKSGPLVSKNTDFITSINNILNNIKLDTDKQSMIKGTSSLYKDIINDFKTSLNRDDQILTIEGLLSNDPDLFKSIDVLKITDSLKLNIITSLIAKDKNLFTTYILENQNFEDFIKNLPSEQKYLLTDITGIYALASSYGIKDGLFIPDNINLTDLDKYISVENEVVTKDTAWRGGTTNNPNNYTEIVDGTPIEDKVNYKIFVEMKQLKKSIAARVFEIELIGKNQDGSLDLNSIIKNNKDVDYDSKPINGIYNINFYIPLNHNILKSNSLIINTEVGHYELSNKAQFDQTDPFIIDLTNITLTEGLIIEDTFNVKAEDESVIKTYNVKVHIIKDSKLEFTSALVNNQIVPTKQVTRTLNNNNYIDYLIESSVDGSNGLIKVNYKTLNMANGISMLDKFNIYPVNIDNFNSSQFNNQTYNAIDFNSKLILDNDYEITQSLDNGIIIIPNTKDTGYNDKTNSYNDGNLFIEINLKNGLKKGLYVLEVTYSDDLKYYVFFMKQPSNKAYIESITYNGQTFNPYILENDIETILPDNMNNMATHKFGTPLTETDFTTNNSLGIPKYLDDLKISPLSTFEVVNVLIDDKTLTGKYIYKVNYKVTAEDGKTFKEFTHYIRDDEIDTSIMKVYIDGFVDKTGPINKGDNDYIYKSTFEKQEIPSYRFEYNLSNFYYDSLVNNNPLFNAYVCDNTGTVINDPTISDNITINVTEGYDYEVIFSELALSQDYYFKLVYSNECKFNSTVNLTWNIEFDPVKITKFKNRISYLDNVIFNSDTVIASTRTIVDVKEITLDEYNNPKREIVCLPGKIHYNKYDYKYDKITSTITKQDNFYVIGLVDKTMLDLYSPTFYLPYGAKIYRSETIDNVIYNYIPYIDETNQKATFLVNDDGTIFKDELGNTITVTGDINSFTYNNKHYSISPVSGFPTIEVDGKIIENETLYTNYNEKGCFKEELNKFLNVDYRIYAEIYDEIPNDKKNEYITNYHIATQDISNNIRFNIVMKVDNGCTLSDKMEAVYLEFSCFTLIENGATNPNTMTSDYQFYDKAGIFGYFTSTQDGSISNILSHANLQSNTSGWYKIKMFLPKEFTYTFTIKYKGKDVNKTVNNEFYIKSDIFPKTFDIEIIIKNNLNPNDNGAWGVEEEFNSLEKNNQ